VENCGYPGSNPVTLCVLHGREIATIRWYQLVASVNHFIEISYILSSREVGGWCVNLTRKTRVRSSHRPGPAVEKLWKTCSLYANLGIR